MPCCTEPGNCEVEEACPGETKCSKCSPGYSGEADAPRFIEECIQPGRRLRVGGRKTLFGGSDVTQADGCCAGL